MKQFLYGGMLGSPGYICPFAPVAPEIGMRFFKTVVEGRMEAARQMVEEYEDAILNITIPLGYPQAYKSMLYIAGLYRTNLVRPPRISNSVEGLGELREYLKGIGVGK